MKGLIFSLILATAALGQSPAVKSTPASDTLTHTAKQVAVDKVSLQNMFNQARSTMDTSAKQFQTEYDNASKALQDKLKQDKNYAGDLSHSEAIQNQMKSLGD